ncbi:MAG: NAD(P)-dependent oxidoreductase [Polyangiaceae bacterium]|nr:NAD(P)-dependent oxidoreductase [Polyangiaceae bacterium]
MRVLVTGASGFLGSHVAEQLSQQGHTVVALVRKSSNTKFLKTLRNVEFASGAVEDRASIVAAVKGVDAVIHSAGVVKAKSPEEFHAVNAGGTENVLAAVKEAAPGVKKVVFVSSLTVAGPSPDGKAVSIDSRNPVTHYGRSKLAAEDAVVAEKDNLPVVVLRPPMIYGPRDQESFAFFQSVSRRFLPYLGTGENTMSVIYGSDAAIACIKAITADVPSGSRYFIDDGKVYVWKEMLADIEAALARKAFIRFSVPFSVLKAAAFASETAGKLSGKAVMLTRDKVNELSAAHWVCDSTDAQRDLGWSPEVDWKKGTQLAADWYRENGWL